MSKFAQISGQILSLLLKSRWHNGESMFFGNVLNGARRAGLITTLASSYFLQEAMAQTTNNDTSTDTLSTEHSIGFFVATGLIIAISIVGIVATCYYRNRQPEARAERYFAV
jgi:hypothetical protein